MAAHISVKSQADLMRVINNSKATVVDLQSAVHFINETQVKIPNISGVYSKIIGHPNANLPVLTAVDASMNIYRFGIKNIDTNTLKTERISRAANIKLVQAKDFDHFYYAVKTLLTSIPLNAQFLGGLEYAASSHFVTPEIINFELNNLYTRVSRNKNSALLSLLTQGIVKVVQAAYKNFRKPGSESNSRSRVTYHNMKLLLDRLYAVNKSTPEMLMQVKKGFESLSLADSVRAINVNLSDRDLKDPSNQVGANYTGSHITNSDMRGVDLTDAVLAFTTIDSVELIGANLSNVDLTGATLKNLDLSRTIMGNLDTSRAKLENVILPEGMTKISGEVKNVTMNALTPPTNRGYGNWDINISSVIGSKLTINSNADYSFAISNSNIDGLSAKSIDVYHLFEIKESSLRHADFRGVSADDMMFSGKIDLSYSDLRNLHAKQLALHDSADVEADLTCAVIDDITSIKHFPKSGDAIDWMKQQGAVEFDSSDYDRCYPNKKPAPTNGKSTCTGPNCPAAATGQQD